MKKAIQLSSLSIILGLISINLQSQITITDADLVGGQTYTWTASNTYILDGIVYIEAGGKLNIEPGTVIKGKPGVGGNPPGTLVISRDAQIFAQGTAANPITFTSVQDDLSGTVLTENDNGLWGVLIILGRAKMRKNGNDSVTIEGIPGADPRAFYGGFDNADNSGIITYVTIRHGGFALTTGNEINGLTLGAVGSGTTIHHVEIYANSDDGIEFFGGTVNVSHLISAYNDDDAIDWDHGFRGKIQFALVVQNQSAGSALELDGASPDAEPFFSNPTVYNLTAIGSGQSVSPGENEIGVLMRDNTGGTLANSIFYDFAAEGLEVEDLSQTNVDSYNRINNELNLLNNIWWQFGAGNTLDTAGFLKPTDTSATDPSCATLISHLSTNGNLATDPKIGGVSRDAGLATLNPIASATAVTSGLAAYPTSDPFFVSVGYKGAFDANNATWITGWTSLDLYSHLAAAVGIEEKPTIQLDLYPNPAKRDINIVFKTEHAGNVLVQIYSIDGKLVLTLNKKCITGNNKIILNVSNFVSGMYILNLTTPEGGNLTKKLSIIN